MAARQSTVHEFDRYEQLMAPARERFALSGGLRVLQSRADEVFLEAFLLHFCSLGAQMTRPVETWIGRAAARCAEIGLSELARALANHAEAEAGHHLMMIADVASLTARWNALRQPPMSADDLLCQPPSPGVLEYCRVHEENIASGTPYAQIAIEYEIEMLPLRFGELFIKKCIDALGPEIVSCLSFLTEHVKLDIGHTKLNVTLMKEMLRRDSQSISALVSAGAAALDAYAAFLSDCVRLADEEARKTHRPPGIETSSAALSWSVYLPPGRAPRESEGVSGNWMEDVGSLRGSALFDNGRRPHFQKDGTFIDEDPIDIHAHHILAYDGGQLVGCVRVYCPAIDAPPCVTETLLGEHTFVLLLEQVGLPRSSVVEIGRWTVDPNHRSSGRLAMRLAAGSAALANALRYASETPRDLVLCSAGSIDRQDVMLGRIGLTELPGVEPVYSDKYMDTVRVFSCSAMDSLSPRFQRLVVEMAIKLGVEDFCDSRGRHGTGVGDRCRWP